MSKPDSKTHVAINIACDVITCVSNSSVYLELSSMALNMSHNDIKPIKLDPLHVNIISPRMWIIICMIYVFNALANNMWTHTCVISHMYVKHLKMYKTCMQIEHVTILDIACLASLEIVCLCIDCMSGEFICMYMILQVRDIWYDAHMQSQTRACIQIIDRHIYKHSQTSTHMHMFAHINF